MSLVFTCHDDVINKLDSSPALLSSFRNAFSNLPNSFWDNGTALTAVKCISLFILSTFRLLPEPFYLDGVGGHVLITHCGRLKYLPHPFDKAYYSKDLLYNLFSLGIIQRLGGFYTVNPPNQLELLILTSQQGLLIATARLSADNLLPFQLPSHIPVIASSQLPLLIDMTRNVGAKDSLELGDNSSDLLLGSAGGANVAGEVLSAPLAHKHNREQISRADSALQVHDYNHGLNSYNGTACKNGMILTDWPV
jgi:hypothetical protein